MKSVVGVSFKLGGKVYNFVSEGLNLKKNLTVIVETENGLQFGLVTDLNVECDKNIDSLKKVVRIATKSDYKKNLRNIEDAKNALVKCRELIEEEKLNMNVIECLFNFDRSKMIFKFLSDDRVDFRNLVKSLAAIYKTRIEMLQVGIRDKAKEVGGYGICGCKLCCSRFLKDLDSVSINMAKTQNLSLNPTKINGLCGRLMCCLKYENEEYKNCRKGLPKVGDKVQTEHGMGDVVSVDILNRKFTVNIEGYGHLEKSICDGEV